MLTISDWRMHLGAFEHKFGFFYLNINTQADDLSHSLYFLVFSFTVRDSQTGADKYVSKVWKQSRNIKTRSKHGCQQYVRIQKKNRFEFGFLNDKRIKKVETGRWLLFLFIVSKIPLPFLKAGEGSEPTTFACNLAIQGKSCRILIGCASCWQVILAVFCLNCSGFWVASSFIHFSFTIYVDGFKPVDLIPL